jgi:hypothetical protein
MWRSNVNPEQESRNNPMIIWLAVVAVIAVVVWAVSIVFEIAIVKALAFVILALFATAIAALLLGVAPF